MDPSVFMAQAEFAAQNAATPKAATGPISDSRIRETAEEFEAFFVSTVMETMYAGIETDGVFGGGQGEKVFRSLLLQEYGKSVAGGSGLGIADAVQREMLRIQEASQS